MILEDLEELIEKQSNDDGLWFDAETAPEAYIQRALRQLHHAVEDVLKQRDEWLSQKLNVPNDGGSNE